MKLWRSGSLGSAAAVGATLMFSWATSGAQDADALTPFLGTWSGVFTTQDNEFWGLEEFACFAGCPPEVRGRMRALLDDPANDAVPFTVLMGQANAYAAPHLANLLTPLGKQIQAENTNENDPKLYCQPYGLVREATNPLPIRIRRDGNDLLIQYEEWSLLRPIYMDGREHPQYRTPSMLGHSVGRVENGVLIVETARVLPDRYSDFTQGGYSDELTAVERYTIKDNPRRLELEMTLRDPVTLTGTYVMSKIWLFTPDVELVEDRCGAFPGKF
jgi:hypothetical protein